MILKSNASVSVTFRRLRSLLVGTSMLTAAPALAQTGQPAGQTTPASPTANPTSAGDSVTSNSDTGTSADIVVTGIRAANQSAIRIKRNSDTVVDAISAEDIGALPDKSITETLQRIPGVSVNRFSAINDPDHVSAQGQSPVIRGLPYVASQFNGREAFSANGGRALNFQDIPPDLAATVEVYKNQTADQIEGGIAGLVNIVTRRPLDSTRDIFVINANGNYGDQRGRVSPEVSGLFSKQFDTGAGRFGILGSASFSRVYERVDNARITTYRDYRSAGGGRPASEAGPLQTVDANGNNAAVFGTAGTDYYVPIGSGYGRQDTERARYGLSGALQWESTDRRHLLTAQYIYARQDQFYDERTIAPIEDTAASAGTRGLSSVRLLAGTTPTFNGSNVLTSGTLVSADGTGIGTQQLTRGRDLSASTSDYSGHYSFTPDEHFKLDLDGQYVKSSSRTVDASIVAVNEANYGFDARGDFPFTTFLQPARYLTGGYANVARNTATTSTSATADPRTAFFRSAQDHHDNTKGDEFAFRGDLQYGFDEGSFLRKVRVGARYAERKQTVRSDGYNWGNLSERWAGNYTPVGTVAAASPVVGATFGAPNANFLHDATGQIPFFGFNFNPASNFDLFKRVTSGITGVTKGFYAPLDTRADVVPVSQGGDGFHTPAETSTNNEKTYAAYGRVDFGIESDSGFKIDGNVGLRYVHTKSASTGSYLIPSYGVTSGGLYLLPNGVTPQNLACTPGFTPPPQSNGQPAIFNICRNTPEQRASLFQFIGNGGAIASATRQTYDDWLPSFNLRIAPSDELQFRLAYAKAITRPSFTDLVNQATFGIFTAPAGTAPNSPYPTTLLVANAKGNPLLRPTKSDNFDVTGEYYYSDSGSFTLGLFYKRLKNITSTTNGQASAAVGVDPSGANPSILPYTANGATQTAYVNIATNNDRTFNLKGFEVDFRQGTLPFLTGALSGLGVQANFTYIDADKLSQQPNIAQNYDATRTPATQLSGYLDSLPFPGISKYSANGTVFYEKYGVSARVSYTWRAKYLVASIDSLGPADPTYTGDAGFLDASFAYAFTPVIKFVVQGSNLSNTKIKTYNQINREGLLALRAVNETDRRVTFGFRLGL